ncbi:PAS domain S-box protein [Candidatus Latescibacterota bacterium]
MDRPFKENDHHAGINKSDVISASKSCEKLWRETLILKQIIDFSPYCIVIFDANGIFLCGNKAFTNMFGKVNAGAYSLFDDPTLKEKGLDQLVHSLVSGGIIKIPVEVCYNPHTMNPEFPDKEYFLNGVAFSLCGSGHTIEYMVFMYEDVTEQKLDMQDHRETMARLTALEAMINRSPAILFLWRIDVEWPVEFVSDNVTQVLGYTAEEFLSGEVSWLGITLDEDKARLESEIASKVKKGIRDFSQEYRLISKSGDIRWMRDRNTLLCDDDGNPTHIQSIVLDITEIKLVEMALENSEKKYDELLENISEIIYSIDRNGVMTYVSSTVKTLLGYKPSDIIGKPFSEFVGEKNLSLMEERFKDILSGKVITGEYKILDKDGGSHWFRTSSRPHYVHTELIGIQGLLIDVTERKRAEENLRKSEEKYRQMVENINDVIYETDERGNFTYISPSVEDRSGYHPSELNGHPFSDFIHEYDSQRVREHFKKIMAGAIDTNEFRILTKTGEIIWTLCSTQPVWQNGKITGIRGVCTDITERKKIEEELRVAKLELEMKSVNLEETNTALKVLLKHQDEEKTEVEKNMISSIKTLVFPYLDKLKSAISDDRQKTYANIIETNLSQITKPLTHHITGFNETLTPTELQIVNLIIENLSTKDIASLLFVSETTVFFHRRNIRRKLGLNSKRTNLRSYLQSYETTST